MTIKEPKKPIIFFGKEQDLMGTSRVLIWKIAIFFIRQDDLQPSGKFTARQEDTPPTPQALQPNISTQASDFPVVTTTRMLLTQTQCIT
jgi:hypothetical protein